MAEKHYILHDYFRSSACYRVRIAFALKGIPLTLKTVHLVQHGGEHLSEDYQAMNPLSLVPTLEIVGKKHAHYLTQSLTIIEYLEKEYPTPSLFPTNTLDYWLNSSLSLSICCDIHPINNLRVLVQLKDQFQAKSTDIEQWYHVWLKKGFDAIEAHLKTREESPFAFGDSPCLFDICLIPQVYNAIRFKFDVKQYPNIYRIYEHAMITDAFSQTAPDAN